TSSGLSMTIESLPIANLGETMGIDASFFGATIIGTSTFPFTYFAALNNYIHGYDPAGGGTTDYANSQLDFGHGVLTPLGAWTTFSSQSAGWSATSQYPLYKARITVLALFGSATVTSGQAAQPVIFIDNIKDAFNVQLASQVSGTLPVANLPTIPGSVASFQSGSVTITPAVGAQVTTNITLGTAVNIAKSMVSINWDSATATVSAPGSKAALTLATNLQIVTDAQIGGTAANVNLNWQVLTWN
ncbi:MAG: hypothetical protein KGL35_02390, partial [Bradyrhizobium sp.]|nr:hypothetical protein [Bradyrhizobium sp.]